MKTGPLGFFTGTSVLAAETSLVHGHAVPIGDSHIVLHSRIAVAIGAIFADLAKAWAASCFD